jgi:hypothetical protein
MRLAPTIARIDLAVRTRNESPFTARIEGNANVDIGHTARLGVHRDTLHFFDRQSGAAI